MNARHTAALFIASVASLLGQPASQAPKTPKAGAPVDLTGYWVAIVTEDWRYRMVTPPKGDYASVPISTEGKKVADAWDPAKDEAAGEQCRSYGAPAIMRVPGRLHILWEDDSTLRIDTDAGKQTRLFHFDSKAQPGAPQWQGFSAARWDIPGAARGPDRGGSLKVVTTKIRPGYLRRNGVPNGDSWLIVTTIVEDPKYLTQPFITSTHFRRQAGAGGWNPQPCTSR
jgi:hypothetical protein